MIRSIVYDSHTGVLQTDSEDFDFSTPPDWFPDTVDQLSGGFNHFDVLYKNGESEPLSDEDELIQQIAKWIVEQSQVELVIDRVREKRDRLLRECDWTQLLDVPESTRKHWAGYRQALREVPQQSGYPQDVVWPERPSNIIE